MSGWVDILLVLGGIMMNLCLRNIFISTLTVLTFSIPMMVVFLTTPITVTPVVAGGVQIDKLTLSSDFRLRYEIDDDAGRDDVRDRARIRYRFGMKYELSDRLEFGSRFATTSSSLQSPHQTLGQLSDIGTASQGRNEDFGLDRAYMKYKFMDSGFIWMGKNSVALWQQNEQFWDADYSAEGAAMGNTFKMGEAGSLTVQGGYYFLKDVGWTGIGQDDVIIPVQAVYKRDMGFADLVLAGVTARVEDNSLTLPGGDGQYHQASGQVNFRNFPMPVTVGYDTFIGDDTGYIGTFRTRLDPISEKLRFRIDYAYIPVDSVPLQGMIGQDDFRFTSNFEGAQIQINYDVSNNYNIQFVVYPQQAIEDDLSAGDVVGLGNYVQGAHNTTRYQLNLNVKF